MKKIWAVLSYYIALVIAAGGSVASRIQGITVEIGGETGAGTTQRDVVRLGVMSIPVSFSVSLKWLKLLTGFKQK